MLCLTEEDIFETFKNSTLCNLIFFGFIGGWNSKNSDAIIRIKLAELFQLFKYEILLFRSIVSKTSS